MGPFPQVNSACIEISTMGQLRMEETKGDNHNVQGWGKLIDPTESCPDWEGYLSGDLCKERSWKADRH